MDPEFIQALKTLADHLNASLPTLAATLARVSGIAFFAPGIGERVVPPRVKLAVVFAITAVLAPLAPTSPQIDQTDAPLLILSEAVNGLTIGFALRCAYFALQIAGSIIAQNLSLALAFGTEIGFEQDSAFATVLMMGGLAAASAANIHFHIVSALVDCYEFLPFAAFPGADALGEWSALRASSAFAAALGLSLPFVALGFAYALALAAANRAMAQLPAAFVGAPAITLAGLIVFSAAAGVIIEEWLALFQTLLDFESVFP